MAHETDWMKVAHAGLEIGKHTGAKPPKSHALYRAVLAGEIPAEYRSNCWWMRKRDLPQAAAVFGIAWPNKPASARPSASAA